LNEDVKYCLTPNNCTAIPVLKNGSLVQLNHEHLSPS
jgi:phosphosulfolactate phosphohydrolase-like enzyme